MGRIPTKGFEIVLDHRSEILPGEDPITKYVETGTLRGEQMREAGRSKRFDFLTGIEFDKYYASETFNLLADIYCRSHFEIIVGSSSIYLPDLSKRYECEPVLFNLDAHYCKVDPPIKRTPFPLWRELETIRARSTADIVVIDDVHTFGKERPELRYNGAPDWEDVTVTSLVNFFGDRVEDFDEIYDGLIIWLKRKDVRK